MRDFKDRKKPSRSSEQFFKPTVQTKLSVGSRSDAFEAEADSMVDKVVNKKGGGDVQRSAMPGEENVQQKPLAESISSVQLKEMPKEEEPVQKKADEKEEAPVQKKEQPEEESVQKKEAPEEEPVQKKEEEQEPVQKKEQTEEEAVQKKEAPEEEAVQKKEQSEEEPVQKKDEEEVQKKPAAAAASSASPRVENRLRSTKGKGTQLDSGVRSEMERGFGADFSNVNIHTDGAATEMSKDLGAQAFTNGSDIYFNEGKYDPNSKAGKTLLAHELTHTIQQGAAGAAEKEGNGNVQQQHGSSGENVQRKALEETETQPAEKTEKQGRRQPLSMQGEAQSSFNNREITISNETGWAYILSNQTPGIDLNISANYTNGNHNSNTYYVLLVSIQTGSVIARRPVQPRRRRGQPAVPVPGFPIGTAGAPIPTPVHFDASEAPIDNFRIVIVLDHSQPERNVHFSVTGS